MSICRGLYHIDRAYFLHLACDQVRQLAAIEMRKRVSVNSGNLWLQVPQPDRESIKAQLPDIVLRESKFVSFAHYPGPPVNNSCPQRSGSPLHCPRYCCDRRHRDASQRMASTPPFPSRDCDIFPGNTPRSRHLHPILCLGNHCRGIPGAPSELLQTLRESPSGSREYRSPGDYCQVSHPFFVLARCVDLLPGPWVLSPNTLTLMIRPIL